MSTEQVVEIEQPQVTPDTKFRRGGFRPAAEVIAETEAAPAETPAAQDDADMAAAILADPNITFENAEGVTVAHTQPPAAEEAPKEEAKFKLGGKEFATQEEAWAYAEQLEQERLAADAFRQGVELASQQGKSYSPPQPAIPEVPEEIDPLYYTNPQAYFKKREAEIIERAQAVIETTAKRKQTETETWSQFYNDYPDLASAREFVDLTLQQNWNTLQHVETKQALKQLAEKTRAKLKPIIEARMPRTELPKVATAVSPGSQAQVTTQKSEPQALSMTQQMKKLKRNKAQLR